MNTSFLDYYKQVLEKVSFDYRLLYKEYSKAMATLSETEGKMLNRWLMRKGLHPLMQNRDEKDLVA